MLAAFEMATLNHHSSMPYVQKLISTLSLLQAPRNKVPRKNPSGKVAGAVLF